MTYNMCGNQVDLRGFLGPTSGQPQECVTRTSIKSLLNTCCFFVAALVAEAPDTCWNICCGTRCGRVLEERGPDHWLNTLCCDGGVDVWFTAVCVKSKHAMHLHPIEQRAPSVRHTLAHVPLGFFFCQLDPAPCLA